MEFGIAKLFSKLSSYIPYWYILGIPIAMWCIGISLNRVEMAINHGQMPVHWPGLRPCPWDFDDDMVHSCMDKATRLKILADWIPITFNGEYKGMMSLGDVLVTPWDDFKDYFSLIWLTLILRNYKKDA
jgi:hypothetical protein